MDVTIDLSAIADVRKPLREARMLPSSCYTSTEWYRREVDTIFRPGWVMIGRADQIPEIGSYFNVEVCGELVLAVRGRDGTVRAFSPVCRHRGAVISSGSGKCQAFVCPYHRWSYSIDGDLMSAPHMGTREEVRQLVQGLVPISIEEWQGFLFVNLDGKAKPVSETYSKLDPVLAKYRIGDMRWARSKTYTLACNWKSYVDNSVEAYHVPSVHGKSLEPVAPLGTWHTEVHDGFFVLYGLFPGTLGVLKGESGFPPIPGMSLDKVERHDLAILLPNTILTCTVDAMWWVTVMPISAEESTVLVNHAFPKTTMEREDFATVAKKYYDRFDLVNEEDNKIVEVQHRGFRQAARRPGPYAPQEELVHALAKYVVEHAA